MAKDEINAFLGVGTTYQGRLDFQGSVRIDGNFQGEVESEGTLIVGRDASILGQLRVGQLVLSGRLEGDVQAKIKVILHKSANFKGDITTPILVVEDGAVLQGKVNMERENPAEA